MRLPDLPGDRTGHSCGVVKKKNGKNEVVVAGGSDYDNAALDSVVIFDLQSNAWRTAGN